MIVPQNVLRALIGQSRRRCEAYVEMMRKFGQGLEQLNVEAHQMAAQHRDPVLQRQLEDYIVAVRGAAERNEQHVAQQIHYEVQFQQILQTWLYGRPVALPRGPAENARPAGAPERLPRQPGGPPPRFAPPGEAPARARVAPQSWEPSEATAPPAEALSGYAAHFAQKNKKQAAPPPPANHVAAPAPTPALAPEKSNGPSVKSIPQVEEPSPENEPSPPESS